MSRFLEIQPKVALTVGISTVIGAGIAYGSIKLISNMFSDRPPKTWRKVGEISKIYCFPVKSCGPIILNEISCGNLGPYVNHLRDRVFLVVRQSGEYVTARTYPKMVLINPKVEGDMLELSAPGMENIKIKISDLYKSNRAMKVTIFKDEADCIDCGDEAAKWFTNYIGSEEFRLVFYPSSEPKPVVHDKNHLFKQAEQKDSGALHDETSFMLMNQGSFDDLNTKLEKQVTPLQYRPNFVVEGPKAWEEDSWKWVKIGEETIFRNVQPCIRCIFTNIDPESGERNPKMEPLTTLKSFRTFENIAPGPWFGIHLGIRSKGNVKLGDNVYVG